MGGRIGGGVGVSFPALMPLLPDGGKSGASNPSSFELGFDAGWGINLYCSDGGRGSGASLTERVLSWSPTPPMNRVQTCRACGDRGRARRRLVADEATLAVSALLVTRFIERRRFGNRRFSCRGFGSRRVINSERDDGCADEDEQTLTKVDSRRGVLDPMVDVNVGR